MRAGDAKDLLKNFRKPQAPCSRNFHFIPQNVLVIENTTTLFHATCNEAGSTLLTEEF